MFIKPRDEKACHLELETVEEYCQRVFTTDVDLIAFRSQLREIIINRISDYIFQRYRDWPVADLIQLEGVIEREALKRADLENPKELRGGKRERKPKNAAVQPLGADPA